MIEQLTQNTWMASPTINPAMIPSYVVEVAKNGGTFLIFNGVYLCVESAVRHLKFMEKHLQEASEHLFKYEKTTCVGDQIMHKLEMIDAARRAGTYFRLYVRDLDAVYPCQCCSSSKYETLCSFDEPSFSKINTY